MRGENIEHALGIGDATAGGNFMAQYDFLAVVM